MRAVVLLLVIAFFAACSKSPETSPPSQHVAVPGGVAKDPAAAKQLIAAGAVVVDVRTPAEYGGGHVAGATNIPVGEIGKRVADVDKLVGGDRSKPVVVYCSAGGRAAKAKSALEAAGYTHVVNGGGLGDLQ
jgi:phage shock protein E